MTEQDNNALRELLIGLLASADCVYADEVEAEVLGYARADGLIIVLGERVLVTDAGVAWARQHIDERLGHDDNPEIGDWVMVKDEPGVGCIVGMHRDAASPVWTYIVRFDDGREVRVQAEMMEVVSEWD